MPEDGTVGASVAAGVTLWLRLIVPENPLRLASVTKIWLEVPAEIVTEDGDNAMLKSVKANTVVAE